MLIRMAISFKQYHPNLPIIELELQLYHDGSLISELISYETVSEAVELIEKIMEECGGKFLSMMPRGEISKDAKMAVFMTISFVYFEQIEEFNELIQDAFS